MFLAGITPSGNVETKTEGSTDASDLTKKLLEKAGVKIEEKPTEDPDLPPKRSLSPDIAATVPEGSNPISTEKTLVAT